MPDINWNALYGFWLVAECGSFSEAARASPRGSAQALHKRIRRLESSENLRLCLLRSRGVKGVDLTPAGRALFQIVDPLFRDFDRIAAELREENEGPLTIAASEYCCHNYIADIMARYCGEFPKVSLLVHMADPADVLALLESGRYDFGICSPLAKPASVEVKAGAPLLPRIIAPRRHNFGAGPLKWEDVLREPLILPERTATLRRAFDELMERLRLSDRVRVKAEFTTPELCVEAVRSGLGVALTNIASRFGRTLRDVAKICPPPGLPKLEVAVLCRGDRYLPRYMRAFVEVAGAVLKREVGDGSKSGALSGK